MPPEFSLLSGESPAQRYLSGGVQPIGEARDPYDGVSAPERYVLNTVARHSSGVQTRKYLMASANQGIEVDAAIEAEQQAKAELQGQTLVKNVAELQQRLPKEDFERALAEVYERLQGVSQGPERAELRDPSPLSQGLAIGASLFAAPRHKFDVLSAPLEAQLADQARRQAENDQDWQARLASANSAGDVLDILAKRQEVELQQDRLDAREQMRIQGRQTLAQMNNATKVQVAEIARSDNDPVWKRDRMVEMGLSQDEANALVTASDRGKMIANQFKQRELDLFNETFEDRVLAASLANDLANERVALTQAQTGLLAERTKYYAKELTARLGILRATLAQREMQTLISAVGLAQKIEETPEIKAQRTLIAGIQKNVAELDAKRKAAKEAYSRLIDPETGKAESDEAKAAETAWLNLDSAYRAAKGVLDAQKKMLSEAQSPKPMIADDDLVQQAINEAMNRVMGDGGGPSLSGDIGG